MTLFRELRDVMWTLADTPIMIGTGLYEQVEVKRTKKRIIPQQPFSERESELANSLANLPKYTACVKATDQQVIVAIPAPVSGLHDAALEARKKRIQLQNRKPDKSGAAYCRSQTDVEAEIMQRQDALRQVTKRAQTTSDEDEVV